MTLSRRQFLHYLGMGTYAALHNPLPLASAARRRKGSLWRPSFFEPIQPSTDDRLILPAGYRADLLCMWGDELGSPDSAQNRDLPFGFNNDFLAYFPITPQQDTLHTEQGLLWVNHEYPDPVFVSEYTAQDVKNRKTKAVDQIRKEKRSVGGSVVYVTREANGQWHREHHPRFTRRFTACSPSFAFAGPAAEAVATVSGHQECQGTLANCSGGQTPWDTVLSCEEHYQSYNSQQEWRLRWMDQPDEAIAEIQFGWVVEVDPLGELPSVKHTNLGRFNHENVAIRFDGPTRRLVVYMGDDKDDQFLYKFVSAKSFSPSASRAEQRSVLTEGTLYAADFQQGKWLALDWKVQKNRLKWQAYNAEARQKEQQSIDSQADILMYTRTAARVLGATPLDRPEGCEIHPSDGSVYIALTNNKKQANFYGQIVRLIEDKDNPEGGRFQFEISLIGGRENGLACPDNLAFDSQGNLWVACGVSSFQIGKDPYVPFGNNGLFVVPTTGSGAGQAYQFASGPKGCELTGPCFTEDGQTLFLSVQHPGEGSPSIDQPYSHWPHGGKEIPRPGVVAIGGFCR